jgi:LmbE family N-acetylglucosaminyl deacetylase
MSESPGTILVSAHPDDVALSVGGSILAGFFRRPLLLITVFSSGGWAPLQPGGYDAEMVSELRAREDERFSSSIGAQWQQLGLTDAGSCVSFGKDMDRMRWISSIVRGEVIRSNEGEIGRVTRGFERRAGGFAGRIPRPQRLSIMEILAKLDRAYVELERKLAETINRFPDASIASPLALGLHPDHVLVACAVRRLAKTRTMFYYEDLPYARTYTQSEVRSHVARFRSGLESVLVDIENVVEGKVDNLRLYSSQLRAKDLENVRKYSKNFVGNRKAYERLWIENPDTRIRPSSL